MVDIVDRLTRGDVSAVIAVLLVALCTLLAYIGRDLIGRIKACEAANAASDKIQAKHTTSIAVINSRLDIVEEDIDQQ